MDDLTGGTRRVSVTHDGKRIGHTEPLDPENPFRRKGGVARTAEGRAAQRAHLMQVMDRARASSARKRGSDGGHNVRANQKRSATLRGKAF